MYTLNTDIRGRTALVRVGITDKRHRACPVPGVLLPSYSLNYKIALCISPILIPLMDTNCQICLAKG